MLSLQAMEGLRGVALLGEVCPLVIIGLEVSEAQQVRLVVSVCLSLSVSLSLSLSLSFSSFSACESVYKTLSYFSSTMSVCFFNDVHKLTL